MAWKFLRTRWAKKENRLERCPSWAATSFSGDSKTSISSLVYMPVTWRYILVEMLFNHFDEWRVYLPGCQEGIHHGEKDRIGEMIILQNKINWFSLYTRSLHSLQFQRKLIQLTFWEKRAQFYQFQIVGEQLLIIIFAWIGWENSRALHDREQFDDCVTADPRPTRQQQRTMTAA